MAMFGIDISNHNRGIDIGSTGAKFCIAKATDGVRFVDPSCDRYVQTCKRLGIPWGVYHFANGMHKSSMRAQADYFVDNCRNYFGEGIPVLDWEDSDEDYGGAVVKYGPGAAKEFLDRVYERTGVRPMLYTYAAAVRAADWSEVAKDYALWGAGYGDGRRTFEAPGTANYSWGAWGAPAIHQYSSAGGLDKDIAYFGPDGWKKFATGKGDEVTMEPHDVWEYHYDADGQNTAPGGNMYNTATETHAMLQQLTSAYDGPDNDGSNGTMLNRIGYIDMRVRQDHETIQAMAAKLDQLATGGIDTGAIAQAVADAVEAKLEAMHIDVKDD